MTRRPFAVACALAIAGPLAHAAQVPKPPAGLLGEGALSNDTVLPVATAAEERFAAGDALFAAARAARPGAPEASAPRAALDAWHAALELTETGDAVRAMLPAAGARAWLPDPAGTRARLVVGVELALRERLVLAGSRTMEAWRAAFEPAARFDLEQAGQRAPALAALERRWPATSSALRAALALADLALESGDVAGARAWLARARDHGAQGDAAGELDAALARRRSALDAAGASEREAGGRPGPAWRAATRLVPAAAFELGEEALRRPAEGTRVLAGATPGPPGGTAGGWIVQGSGALLLVDGAGRATRVPLAAPLVPAAAAFPPAFADRDTDWVHAPAAGPAGLALVAGRSGDDGDNRLLVLATEPVRLAWSRGGAGAGELFPGRRTEFQPGPRVLGRRVAAHVRVFGAESAAEAGTSANDVSGRLDPAAIESWLVALDGRTGALLWQRRLARGASSVAVRERPQLGLRALAPPAAPLGCAGSVIAVSTGLGTLSAVDALDGRLVWSLRAARPGPERPWHRASPAPEEALWAPEDGPSAYALAGPLGPLGLGGLLAGPPLDLADRSVLDREGSGTLALERAGPASLTEDHGAHWAAAFDPGPGERLLCTGRLLERRALVLSDRALYLLDRSRALAVLDRVELAAGEAGRLFVDGDRVWVLGPRRVRGLRAE